MTETAKNCAEAACILDVQDWLDRNAPGFVVEPEGPCWYLLPLLERRME
jgi:hypothetical protein